jgi:hypothetical protein
MAIMMDSHEEGRPDFPNYAEVLSEVLAALKKCNVEVIIKGHPRSGHSPFLDRLQLPSLPAGCPLELFDTSGVGAVFGVVSLGLAAVALQGTRAISLLYLINFPDEKSRTFWRTWMDLHSGGNVVFPNSIAEAIDQIAARVFTAATKED